MRNKLQGILKFLAKKILKKYKPEVIGITGSVGKTSAKEAIATVLGSRFKIRKNEGNYNNEIGLPLTILGCQSPGKSFFGWLRIFARGLRLILIKKNDYPEMLVLEMAADHAGDIRYLTSIAPCKVGVVTAIAPVHLEFFKTVENIVREKEILVGHLKNNDWAILNYDDELVRPMKDRTKARILTFGSGEEADVRAVEIGAAELPPEPDEKPPVLGVNFKLDYRGNIVPVFLPEVLGRHQVYAALAAVAVGLAFKMNLVEISEALKKYQSPPGRMSLISGIKNTMIIDDTYNASPASMEAALAATKEIAVQGKKFAILGDMLELGSFMEKGHLQVGKRAAESGIDVLVTVGEKARDIARGAVRGGLPEDQIFEFGDTEEAGHFVQNKIKQGDLILIKGSRGSHMEKIVKELMAEPLRAEELLVGQE